ncbi:hypothetical protein, partial [Atlantibacter hermannii]|uniref:hypothetical protein n=1 Tax=Atlantibacter hermannii TaxID=565 RepID=UPI0028975179
SSESLAFLYLLKQSFSQRRLPLRPVYRPGKNPQAPGNKQKKTDPEQSTRSGTILHFDMHFNLKFPEGHRLLYRTMHRSMTARFQAVTARLCDLPDLSLDWPQVWR